MIYLGFILSLCLGAANVEAGTVILQNEIDQIDLEAVFTNEKLLDEQLPCILRDGTCDGLGRWLKPRLAKAFLGDCYLCTTKQSDQLIQGIKSLRSDDPQLFQELAMKYLSFK